MRSILLDILYLVFGLPFFLLKALLVPRVRAGWSERFGAVPDLPGGHRLWIHCASVGEALLARTLLAGLEAAYPDAEIVFSTVTRTGRQTVETHFPGHRVFYFPLDLSFVVRKVLNSIKPTAVILVELEVWPNFLGVAERCEVPVVVVNGRITERSARRYRRLGGLFRSTFRRVRHYAVQNTEYASRLAALGVSRDRITVAGTMKYDTVATEIEPASAAAYRRELRLREADTVLLGGCTHPGEDELLIDYAKCRQASGAPLRLVLAPRHSERCEAVERLLRAAGLTPVRKTALDAGTAPAGFEDGPHAILVDTTGELARLYAVATVVFVGGSLVEHGGQNMIEPAALGKAVVFGPHTWNFRETVDLLVANDAAVQIGGADELPATLDALLADPARRDRLGARARALIERSKGATERNVSAVRPFLDVSEKET